MSALRIAAAVGAAGAALTLARSSRATVPAGARPALVAAALSSASLPILRDPLLLCALIARFGAAIGYDAVVHRLYRRSSLDADKYHRLGRMLARELRRGNFGGRLRVRPGVAGMSYLSAAVHLLLGPSRLAASFVFAWLGFLGLVLFHRAFALALPNGDARRYLLLLSFLPSLLVFPSRISKQSWMLFSLGLASLGVARVAEDDRGGLALLAAGTALAALVRPHVAGLVAVSAFVGLGRRVPVYAVTAAAAVGVRHAARWGVDPRGGVQATLRSAGSRSAYGGSAFTPILPTSPVRLPLSVATVLFRPHLLEARSTRVRLAAVENAFVLLLSLARARSFVSAAGDPYGRFALAFTGLFGVAYSGVGNFGLLADHRAQVLPFSLVPLALRPGGAT